MHRTLAGAVSTTPAAGDYRGCGTRRVSAAEFPPTEIRVGDDNA